MAFFRALRDRLQADRDTRTESLSRLAEASFDLGKLIAEIGDQQDALIAYRESVAVFEKLTEANPASTEFQFRLAASHNNVGRALSETGKPAEALKEHEKALVIRQKLADSNPDVARFPGGVADNYDHDLGASC